MASRKFLNHTSTTNSDELDPSDEFILLTEDPTILRGSFR